MRWMQTDRFRAARMGAFAVALSGLAALSIFAVRPTFADAATAQRSVRGRVVSAGDSPISGAIVYLSDARTKDVESYITQRDGAYRFEQLSPNDNYKLWAQANGKKSKTKILSSFDDRSTFHVILKIGSAK